jgi:hypothetical protein
VMLGTMMTVFVRLHYSYKPGLNSGDVTHNDDSICKILSSLCLTSPEFISGLYEYSGDVGHNDESICKITLLIKTGGELR